LLNFFPRVLKVKFYKRTCEKVPGGQRRFVTRKEVMANDFQLKGIYDEKVFLND